MRSDWMEQAACVGTDIDFYSDSVREHELAKRFCAGCPVRVECLNFAIQNRDEYGVWGGTSGRQRVRKFGMKPLRADWVLALRRRLEGASRVA